MEEQFGRITGLSSIPYPTGNASWQATAPPPPFIKGVMEKLIEVQFLNASSVDHGRVEIHLTMSVIDFTKIRMSDIALDTLIWMKVYEKIGGYTVQDSVKPEIVGDNVHFHVLVDRNLGQTETPPIGDPRKDVYVASSDFDPNFKSQDGLSLLSTTEIRDQLRRKKISSYLAELYTKLWGKK